MLNCFLFLFLVFCAWLLPFCFALPCVDHFLWNERMLYVTVVIITEIVKRSELVACENCAVQITHTHTHKRHMYHTHKHVGNTQARAHHIHIQLLRTHARTHPRVHTHTHTHARARAHTHARACTCTHTHTHTHPFLFLSNLFPWFCIVVQCHTSTV